MDKKNQKVYNKYNTLKRNFNKKLQALQIKHDDIDNKITTAKSYVAFMQKYIEENNLKEYIYPIKEKYVLYKLNAIKQDIKDYNRYISNIDKTLNVIENTNSENTLNIFNAICDNKIFCENWSTKIDLKHLKNFELNYDFYDGESYLMLSLNIEDIIVPIGYTNIKTNKNYNSDRTLTELFSTFIALNTNGYGEYKYYHDASCIIMKMSEDKQNEFIIKALNLCPETDYSKILKAFPQNSKTHQTILKLQTFKN